MIEGANDASGNMFSSDNNRTELVLATLKNRITRMSLNKFMD